MSSDSNTRYWNARKPRFPFYVTMTPEAAPRPDKIAKILGDFYSDSHDHRR